MLPAISAALVALAVSLDSLGVGVMYGLRKIRIPLLSIMIIACCSGFVIYGSMKLGSILESFISPLAAQWLGAAILIGIGVWAVFQMRRQKEADQEQELPIASKSSVDVAGPRTILHIEIRKLGLVIEILRKPSRADMDQSGVISASEAALLGIALSLDAFGAGIGLALVGYTPSLMAAIIALSSGAFIWMGLRVGFVFSQAAWMRKLSLLPGFILIVMGIMKLI